MGGCASKRHVATGSHDNVTANDLWREDSFARGAREDFARSTVGHLTQQRNEALQGWYEWNWPGGDKLDVCLRPGGHLFCPSHQAFAIWDQDNEGWLEIDWGKYGKYELCLESGNLCDGTACFGGSEMGFANNWRKATFMCDLSPLEKLLFGTGYGSAWNFSYKDGSFEVHFKADGLNRFRCASYPADSHYAIHPENIVSIDWKQYGVYKLKVDVEKQEMVGSVFGQPADWLTAKHIGALSHYGCGIK